MQVSVKEEGSLGRKLHISIPQAEVDKKVQQEVLAYSKKAKLDGFRPGKIPPNVIQQRFGNEIFNDVVQDLIREFYIQALQSENINPAGQPKFEDLSVKPGSDISFVASIEIFPEFEAATMAGVDLEQPTAEISEQDIDDMVMRVRKNRMLWNETDDKAQQEDRVTMDILGQDKSQEKPVHFEDIQIILGEENNPSQMAEQLLGVCRDEERELAIDDPADPDKLAQVKHYKANIKKVERGKLPELDDEFFNQCGVKEGGIDGFKKLLREGMDAQLKTSIHYLTKSAVMSAILENNKIDLPKSLINEEIQSIKTRKMKEANIKDPSKISDDIYREEAENRVALGLIISKFASQNDIKTDEQSIEDKLEEIAGDYKDSEGVKQHYRSNADARYSLEAMVLEDKVIQHILSVAKVNIKNYSFDELVNKKS